MKTFPSTLKWGEGKKKRERGRKKREKGRKRCVRKAREYFKRSRGRFSTMPCYVLKTFPNTLRGKGRKEGRGEEKRGRGEEKRCAGKGRKYFQRCWGRFSTMLCLETFPSTLKNEGKGRKKMHRVGNDDLLFWKCFSFSKFFSLSDNLYFSKCFSFRGQTLWPQLR